MNLFADDDKLLARIQNEDSAKLQQDLDKIWDWSLKWEIEFNVKKCNVMEFGMSKNRMSDYKLGNVVINKQLSEKDLGVLVSNNLSLSNHINKIVGETYNLLRNVK